MGEPSAAQSLAVTWPCWDAPHTVGPAGDIADALASETAGGDDEISILDRADGRKNPLVIDASVAGEEAAVDVFADVPDWGVPGTHEIVSAHSWGVSWGAPPSVTPFLDIVAKPPLPETYDGLLPPLDHIDLRLQELAALPSFTAAQLRECETLIREAGRILPHLQGVAFQLLSDSGLSPILGGQRLRDMIFERLRAVKTGGPVKDIYSVAIPLDRMSTWNDDIGKKAATDLRGLLYALTREFVASDAAVEDFIAATPLEFFTDPLGNPSAPRGQTTLVNRTLIAMQLSSVERIPLLLDHLEWIVSGVLKRLLLQRDELVRQQLYLIQIGRFAQVDIAMNWIECELARTRLLLGGFEWGEDGQTVVYIQEKPAGGYRQHALAAFRLGGMGAGVARYALSEDTTAGEKGLRNITSVFRLAHAMRDQAIQNAESLAAMLMGCEVLVAGVNRLAWDAVSGRVSHRIFWREGQYLTGRTIYRGLLRILAWEGSTDPRRMFRQFSVSQLMEVAVWCAKQALEDQARQVGAALPVPRNKARRLAGQWLAALRAERADRKHPLIRQFVTAIQQAFTRPVTEPVMLALYQELGGVLEPWRLVRHMAGDSPRTLTRRIAAYFETVRAEALRRRSGPADALDGMGPAVSEALLRELIGDVRRAFHIFRRSSFNLRDGKTRTLATIAPAARRTVEGFYARLAAQGITPQGAVPGYLLVGFEGQYARTIDEEGNAITPNHVMDANMVRLRRLSHAVNWVFRRRLRQIGGPLIALPIEVYAQGDEIVTFMPRHLSDGREIDAPMLIQLARIYRATLRQALPYFIHYEKKIRPPRGAKQLRLKQWRVVLLDGREMLVAGARDCFDTGAEDPRLWPLTRDGRDKKQTKPVTVGELPVVRYEPVRGKIGCRLCVLPVALSPLTPYGTPLLHTDMDEHLLDRMFHVIDRDVEVKRRPRASKRIYFIDPTSGALRRIRTRSPA